MKYRIQHITEYRYQEPVSVCHNRLCLSPATSENQSCVSFELNISPKPDELTKRVDFFGNELVFFSMYKEHNHLKVTSTSEVSIGAEKSGAESSVVGWQQVKQLISADISLSYQVMAYTLPSQHIPVSESIRSFCADCFTDGATLWEAGNRLMNKIYSTFEFKPGFTTVNTPVDFALRARKGVCQDFAHVMIACFRNYGLPARYVSGYIETFPAPGKEKLAGSDASHAWVSVYFPGTGWVEFDPTNNLHPSDKHIRVAVGRDYQDVAPIKGIIFGSGNQTLDVKVDVRPLS